MRTGKEEKGEKKEEDEEETHERRNEEIWRKHEEPVITRGVEREQWRRN